MSKLITSLQPNEIFVFGSNVSGFHGAGSAGFAFHGDKGNSWRTNPTFQKAYQALQAKERGKAFNPEDLKGNWAVLGENGLMEGKLGKSYGIITTEAPGKQGKVDDTYLRNEMSRLIACANRYPELKFLCVNFGLSRAHGGFSWWNPKQLQNIWDKALQDQGGNMPTNLIAPEWSQAKKPTGPNLELDL